MKTRTWENSQLRIRVVERNPEGIVKEGIECTYDVQIRKHHIWCPKAKGLTKAKVELMLNMEIK